MSTGESRLYFTMLKKWLHGTFTRLSTAIIQGWWHGSASEGWGNCTPSFWLMHVHLNSAGVNFHGTWYVYMQALTHIPLKHTPDQWPIVHKGSSSFCEFGEVWGIWGYVGKTIKYKCIFIYIYIYAQIYTCKCFVKWTHVERSAVVDIDSKGKIYICRLRCNSRKPNSCIPKEQLGPHHFNFQHPQGQGKSFLQWLDHQRKKNVYIYIYPIFSFSCCFPPVAFLGCPADPCVSGAKWGSTFKWRSCKPSWTKYPQHLLAKSCSDHFGRRKLRTYQKLIYISPFTLAG